VGQDFCCLLCCDDVDGACFVGFGLVRVCARTVAVIVEAEATAAKRTAKARRRNRLGDEAAIRAYTAHTPVRLAYARPWV
jgi:hypothetical protein